MKRAQRLTSLWNWLPAFRAVAETEHLPTASEALNVSASALSRSIRLLEEDVGQPLFDRVGRNIHLNATGARLLTAVRDAMRLLDEGLQAVGDGQLVGPVHIAISGPFAPLLVLPIAPALRAAHPGLVPHLRTCNTSELGDQLRQGNLDVALSDVPLEDSELLTESVCAIVHAIYRSPSHVLAKTSKPTHTDILAFPFVAPDLDRQGVTPDGFPPHFKRNIGLRVSQMNVGIEACKTGDYLAVLPVMIAERSDLVRVPFEDLPHSTMYMVQRKPLGVGGRAEVVAAAIRDLVRGFAQAAA